MNKATGNMYEGWVTHTWNPLNGECSHHCEYCFVKRTPAGRMGFYSGPLRLNHRAMRESHGKGRKIFVCDLNDLFARYTVSPSTILSVLERCQHPQTHYIFQSKDPEYMGRFRHMMPPPSQRTLGTTVESDLAPTYNAPSIADRLRAISALRHFGEQVFITIEPIMVFAPCFAAMLIEARPSFINIGADSKRRRLLEPTRDEVLQLIADLRGAGIEVRIKPNLERIVGKGVK